VDEGTAVAARLSARPKERTLGILHAVAARIIAIVSPEARKWISRSRVRVPGGNPGPARTGKAVTTAGGGGRGIRTPGQVAPPVVFKTLEDYLSQGIPLSPKNHHYIDIVVFIVY